MCLLVIGGEKHLNPDDGEEKGIFNARRAENSSLLVFSAAASPVSEKKKKKRLGSTMATCISN